jgi:dihydrolipoamide dehydrogenase
MNTVIVERYATLGGVCLNVGCIPSKALLHVASVIDETAHMSNTGVTFAKPTIDIDQVRKYKEGVIKNMTGGLAGMAKARKTQIVTGVGQFLSANHIEVTAKDGSKKVVQFKQAIIAAGSSVVKLPFVPEDPRIVDSTGALELRQIPKRMLVIGGGIIGLEMATVYSTFGARIDVVEMMDGLMQGADRDAVKVWQKYNEARFDNIMTKTKTVAVEALPEGIKVTFEAAEAGARLRRKSTTWCWWPWAAARTARRSRRQGWRGGDRPRLHPGRQPDAHQRAAHLRHRRPGGPADAGAQGGA